LNQNKKPDARKIALFSVTVALCVAIQILPRPVGLEFTSFLTFCIGVVLGSVFGALLGTSVMFANAFLSSYGLAGLSAPFQIVGMGLIGAVGGFYKMDKDDHARFYVETAVLGAFLTFIYYTITNLSYAVIVALPPSEIPILEAIVISQVNGIVFTLLYMVSNTVLFGIGAVPLVTAMRKFLRR
jgi:hypothetical protein